MAPSPLRRPGPELKPPRRLFGEPMNAWMENAYRRLPAPAQNLAISLYGRIWQRRRLGGDFDRVIAEFRGRDHWSRTQMHDYVTAQLRRTLPDAFDNSPYYREKWSAIGVTRADLERAAPDDLSALPSTPKADFRRYSENFVSELAPKKKLHAYPTSGSSGTPVVVRYTTEAHRGFIAAREVRSFGWAGVSVRMPRSTLGGRMVVPPENPRPPYYRYNAAERHVYLPAFFISRATAPSYVEGLNRYQPTVLTGYAHAHFALARFMLDRGLRLSYRPQALIVGSEKLTPEMRPVVEEAFQARAFEEYGAAENCVLATECEHGRLHVSVDFGLMEIVDAEGRPTRPGEPGRVLCTGFMNSAQPLVRYEIGDSAAWSAEACPCGRDQFPVLEGLMGRIEDVAYAPDGRAVSILHSLFLGMPIIEEAQIVQERLDMFRIRVVASPEFGAREESAIRERLFQRVGKVQVVFERPERIERTARGKFKVFVSRLSEEDKRRASALETV